MGGPGWPASLGALGGRALPASLLNMRATRPSQAKPQDGLHNTPSPRRPGHGAGLSLRPSPGSEHHQLTEWGRWAASFSTPCSFPEGRKPIFDAAAALLGNVLHFPRGYQPPIISSWGRRKETQCPHPGTIQVLGSPPSPNTSALSLGPWQWLDKTPTLPWRRLKVMAQVETCL